MESNRGRSAYRTLVVAAGTLVRMPIGMLDQDLPTPGEQQQGQISVSAYASEQHGAVSVPTYDIRWEQQADVLSSHGVTARLNGA